VRGGGRPGGAEFVNDSILADIRNPFHEATRLEDVRLVNNLKSVSCCRKLNTGKPVAWKNWAGVANSFARSGLHSFGDPE
jgi:hypothetical protein